MKKAVLTGAFSLFSLSLLFAQAGVDKLPQNSKDFIAQHFSSETIAAVQIEKSFIPWENDDMYEVHFSSGLELNFNKDGEVTEIDSARDQAIPAAALPTEITAYVNSTYEGTAIVSWETDGDQEVELANGVDLEFDDNGKFVKVD